MNMTLKSSRYARQRGLSLVTTLVLMLAYPRERYEALGATSFEDFGRRCDGERTPWVEWYDDDKVRRLFGLLSGILSGAKGDQAGWEAGARGLCRAPVPPDPPRRGPDPH